MPPDGARPGAVVLITGHDLYQQTAPAEPSRIVNLRGYHDLAVPRGTEAPPPPPPVPPGMTRPVTKSDPPVYNLAVGLSIERQAGDLARAPYDPAPVSYQPARVPVHPSDPDNWPQFPGEGLNYRGGDPGDEDIHTGGPR